MGYNRIGYFSRGLILNKRYRKISIQVCLFIGHEQFKFASDISTCSICNRIYDGIKEITNRFHFAFETRDRRVTRHGGKALAPIQSGQKYIRFSPRRKNTKNLRAIHRFESKRLVTGRTGKRSPLDANFPLS